MWYEPEFNNYPEERLTLLKEERDSLIGNLERFYQDIRKFEMLYQKRSMSRNVLHKLSKQENVEFDTEENTHEYNVIRLNCNAATTQITSSKPKPVFTTEDQDHETRQISEKLGKYIAREFKEKNVYEKGTKAFFHACLARLGVIKVFSDNFRVIHPKLMLVPDPYEGTDVSSEYKKCGNIGQCSPFELLRKFPKKYNKIEATYLNKYIDAPWGKKDMQDVYYTEMFMAGHRHCVFTDEILLYDGTWNHNFIPYELFGWESTSEGSLNYSISEALDEMQEFITDLLEDIRDSSRHLGLPVHYIPTASKVKKSEMTDDIGKVIEFAGNQKPSTSTPPILHPQYFELVEGLFNKSFVVCGNNPLNVSGELPPQLNQASGIALQNYSDLDSKKFSSIRDRYEKNFLSMAMKYLLIGGKKKLSFDPDLQKINLKEELRKIDIKTGSVMPDSVSGQLQTAQFLMTTGALSPEDALSMMKSPDIKKKLSSVTDAVESIDLAIERAIKENKKPVLYKELGVGLWLDRARKQFAQILKRSGDNDPALVPLAELIEEALFEMNKDQQDIQDTLT